ncbi:hypothetical tonB2 protein [Parvularcula bermudensis HTCC2503]|uniref:Hypothetical tonB2 protein n=1 Tax=Parvularcula bermudensis (strain ATCC BAA-594 / HTCC2503 / KCTC 12087) TaxID=314260 RepID=E0TI22_PARBH|nr:energy transducer TonB [Parvularcula bermudensis]ADM09361.1 hypothetical tonB2 protein [Parvularcula bermudensis HTCC2503]
MASLLRGFVGLPLAAIVTVFLFLFMWGLIRVNELPPAEDRQQANISFTRQIQDTEIRNQKVFERPSLDQPPPPPPAINNATFQPSVEGVRAQAPSFDADVDIGSGFNPDRDAQPIVRIPPTNWERCIDDRQAGTTQRVSLEFDVTPEGQVTNVNVLDSTDRCYERYATRAAERWKYNPKIVDGEAQPRFGVRTVIEFQIGSE